MPLDKDRVKQGLAQLEEYVRQLRELEDKPESEYTAMSVTEAAAERMVYKAMQAALDVAGVVAASLGFGAPKFYRDLFVQLGDKGIITRELQTRLEAMTGMRNKLAHEYAKIDPQQIYQVVQKDYQDLIEFAQAVVKYIETQP